MLKKLISTLTLKSLSRYLGFMLVCLLFWTASTAQATVVSTTIIPYLDTGYKFKVVSFGEGSGFEQPSFNDSNFSTGDAGFGTPSGYCSLNNPSDVKTNWSLNTDILLRKEFNLPRGVTNLKVGVAIDNDVQVFINGHDISGGLQVHGDCPSRDSFVFTSPDGILNTGNNLIAVRGRDRGVLSYLDIQVTADIPQANISGFKINDTNGNGVWDLGEMGIENWNIKLLNATTETFNLRIYRM